MENLTLIKPKKVQNIINKFCYTIGMIPTSYKVSLTYEEQIIAIGKYLEETVIPALNNNAEAVAELQSLFIQLKDYVENYFDDLNVQNEIDNKLNKMVEDGTLSSVINEQIFNELNNKININTNNISKNSNSINNIINNENNNTTIMIGDSYGIGITSGGTITGWCDRVKNLLDLPNEQYYKFVEGGSGFCKQGVNSHNFLQLLKSNIDTIIDKNLVKNIIVCGGFNDNSYYSQDLNQNISDFVNYCKNNFPNAKIYCGMIGNSGASDNTGTTIRESLSNNVLRSYQNIVAFKNCFYLNGIEYIMHDYFDFMSNDNIHPNELGYSYLSYYIVQALKTGYAHYCSSQQSATAVLDNSDSTLLIMSQINDNIASIKMNDTAINFKEDITLPQILTLGNIVLPHTRYTRNIVDIDCKFYVLDRINHKFYGGMGKLSLTNSNNLVLKTQILNNNGDAYSAPSNVNFLQLYAFNKTFSLLDT